MFLPASTPWWLRAVSVTLLVVVVVDVTIGHARLLWLVALLGAVEIAGLVYWRKGLENRGQ